MAPTAPVLDAALIRKGGATAPPCWVALKPQGLSGDDVYLTHTIGPPPLAVSPQLASRVLDTRNQAAETRTELAPRHVLD
jgi:hypothetical protein